MISGLILVLVTPRSERERERERERSIRTHGTLNRLCKDADWLNALVQILKSVEKQCANLLRPEVAEDEACENLVVEAITLGETATSHQSTHTLIHTHPCPRAMSSLNNPSALAL